MVLRGLHGFLRDVRSSFRKCGKNSSGMKPPAAIFGEDLFPVDFSLLELRDCGMAPVGATHRGPQSKAAFGEVQAIADLPEVVMHRGLVHLQAAEFLYETRLFP